MTDPKLAFKTASIQSTGDGLNQDSTPLFFFNNMFRLDVRNNTEDLPLLLLHCDFNVYKLYKLYKLTFS